MTISELLKLGVVFIGSDWQPDETVASGIFPGHRYAGNKPVVNCNDIFYWGCADCEDITEETLVEFETALTDCNGNIEIGAVLYCARRRRQRPQGAAYSFIQVDLWPLFDACGPKREVGFGNPYEPGHYRPSAQPAREPDASPQLAVEKHE